MGNKRSKLLTAAIMMAVVGFVMIGLSVFMPWWGMRYTHIERDNDGDVTYFYEETSSKSPGNLDEHHRFMLLADSVWVFLNLILIPLGVDLFLAFLFLLSLVLYRAGRLKTRAMIFVVGPVMVLCLLITPVLFIVGMHYSWVLENEVWDSQYDSDNPNLKHISEKPWGDASDRDYYQNVTVKEQNLRWGPDVGFFTMLLGIPCLATAFALPLFKKRRGDNEGQ